jgi:hypothetical protein
MDACHAGDARAIAKHTLPIARADPILDSFVLGMAGSLSPTVQSPNGQAKAGASSSN